MMARRTSTVRTTTVLWVAKPSGETRRNGPHLGDLRAFVAECDGLPGDTPVRITEGNLSESGRRDVTFEVTLREPVDLP